MSIECISLIGMPGAGKSTIVKKLARSLGFTWIDTDLLMEAWFGRSLEEIRNSLGNQSFLEAEAQIVSNIFVKRCVIATGGSVIYNERSMIRLKELGPIVYLKCDLKELESRISKNPNRGLVMAKGQDLKDLYLERIPLYEKYSDLQVPTDKYNIDECIKIIVSWINNHEKKENS